MVHIGRAAQLSYVRRAGHVYRDGRFMADESSIYTGTGWNFASD
jgi:hypothetical protein